MKPLTTLTAPVGARLKAADQTVCVAESSTGGLISASLLAVPGASAYFVAGAVVYSMRSRKVLMQIRSEDFEGLEPLTEAMALRFAQVARAQMNTTWAIAELGVAGPGPARYGHAAGLSVIAVDGPVSRAITVNTGSDDREGNMWAFSDAALQLLGELVP